jgi:soluble lytic murein transglycosylase-like protein
MTLCRVLLAGLAFLWCASPASAQIYAWRDAAGTLVLSDQPLDTPAEVFEVARAPGIRTTRPVATTGADQFEGLVQAHAARYDLRPELVRAVIQVESGFNPRARSPKGAMGLMQLMPATARDLGVSDPFDPDQNIRGGTRYLRELLDRYDGNERLALAAYNAGPGAVERHGRQVPPFRETQEYVRRVGTLEAPAGDNQANAPRLVIYKSIQIVEGRVVLRYSTEPPPAGSYEIVTR